MNRVRYYTFYASLFLPACQLGGTPAPEAPGVSAEERGTDDDAPPFVRRAADPSDLLTDTATLTEWADESLEEEIADGARLSPPDDGPPPEPEAAEIPPVLAVPGAVSFDIPMATDPRVQRWVDYLSGRGRTWFARWLARSTRYVPIFWEILDEYDLPRDLVFVSMVESGFSPIAYSWAHAAGAWQFMPFTGRHYGLRVGFWVDERRDFEKSTHAAARYLAELHETFDDWHLAFAAYNAGPGRVRRAIRATGSDDFWRISRTWRLHRETKHYVPKILAAARIAKEPERYGFEDVVYLPELEWETVTVTVATDLKTLSAACGLEPDDRSLSILNPELRCGVTPPGGAYPTRVPLERRAACEVGIRSIPPEGRVTYRYSPVGRKDSLRRIARRFRTTKAAIVAFHGVSERELMKLDELVVPVPVAHAHEVPLIEPEPRRYRPSRYRPEGQRLIVHRVRRGESLWRIARRYGVSIRKLRLWNGLWRKNTLQVGQRLRVYVGRGRAPTSG